MLHRASGEENVGSSVSVEMSVPHLTTTTRTPETITPRRYHGNRMDATLRDQLTSFLAASFALGDPRWLSMFVCTCIPQREVAMEQLRRFRLDRQ